MTPAEQAFNTMVQHLRKQNAVSSLAVEYGTACDTSVSPMGSICAYRGSNGRKCAVGALIPDDKYRPGMENKSCEVINRNYNLGWNDLTVEVCGQMQEVHDSYDPKEWEEHFERVAYHFGFLFTEKK